MNDRILSAAKWLAVAFALSLFSIVQWGERHDKKSNDLVKMTGSMNAIIYYRHKHHEPRASWLIMAAQQPGQIADTDEAVNNLELKADVWESEHYVKEIK